MTTSELAVAARLHADNLSADVRVAANRMDHILRTQRALEAEQLANELERQAGAESFPPAPQVSAHAFEV